MQLDYKIHSGLRFMKAAIREAERSFRMGEHPEGAALVSMRGTVLACSGNRCHQDLDASAHAETVVIRRGCRRLHRRYLEGCVLYSTHVLCPMCAWTVITLKVSVVIWGTDTRHAQDIAGDSFRIQPCYAGGAILVFMREILIVV